MKAFTVDVRRREMFTIEMISESVVRYGELGTVQFAPEVQDEPHPVETFPSAPPLPRPWAPTPPTSRAYELAAKLVDTSGTPAEVEQAAYQVEHEALALSPKSLGRMLSHVGRMCSLSALGAEQQRIVRDLFARLDGMSGDAPGGRD